MNALTQTGVPCSRLIYLSPTPWDSYAQRPHKFVEWVHASTGAEVLWVDPYHTRFPVWRDVYRPARQRLGGAAKPVPPWLRVVSLRCLPIEPLPGSGRVNARFWRAELEAVARFASGGAALMVAGKPTEFALQVLQRLPGVPSLYDAMDDFPAFYRGISRRAMAARERALVRQVTRVWASSTALQQHWQVMRPDVRLVRNALDAAALPDRAVRPAGAELCASRCDVPGKVFGYVGTLGHWFDWDWVLALARLRPQDRIRLIGPVFFRPAAVPDNVSLEPPLPHAEALRAMLDFDVGLIPFVRNDLTASVDPIKYYEYRALGLPVVSTSFGEMALRTAGEGVFLSHSAAGLGQPVDAALQYRSNAQTIADFIAGNTWGARFAASGLF